MDVSWDPFAGVGKHLKRQAWHTPEHDVGHVVHGPAFWRRVYGRAEVSHQRPSTCQIMPRKSRVFANGA